MSFGPDIRWAPARRRAAPPGVPLHSSPLPWRSTWFPSVHPTERLAPRRSARRDRSGQRGPAGSAGGRCDRNAARWIP